MTDQDDFNDFFLKAATINCKLKLKAQLNEEQEKQYKILICLIRAFNMIEKDTNISLDDIIMDNVPDDEPTTVKKNDYHSSDTKYDHLNRPIYNHTTNYTHHGVYNYPKRAPSPVLEKIDDPEGDKLVEQMTICALEKYTKIVSTSRWIIVSEKTMDLDSEETCDLSSADSSDTDTLSYESTEGNFLTTSDGEIEHIVDEETDSANLYNMVTNTFVNTDIDSGSSSDNDYIHRRNSCDGNLNRHPPGIHYNSYNMY